MIGRAVGEYNVVCLGQCDGLIHIFGVVQHLADKLHLAQGLLIRVVSAVGLRNRHNTDRQAIFIHAIKGNLGRQQQGQLIQQARLGVFIESEVGDIDHGYGSITVSRVREQQQGGVGIPVEIPAEYCIRLRTHRSKAGTLGIITLREQLVDSPLFKAVQSPAGLKVFHAIIAVIPHGIKRELIHFFE